MASGMDKKIVGVQRSFGQRRRYKGKMVGPGGVPRSSGGSGHMKGAAGFEAGQKEALPTKGVPGVYKVQMPHNKIRHCWGTRPQGSPEWERPRG